MSEKEDKDKKTLSERLNLTNKKRWAYAILLSSISLLAVPIIYILLNGLDKKNIEDGGNNEQTTDVIGESNESECELLSAAERDMKYRQKGGKIRENE